MTELFHITHHNLGSIEVICGSMFSGKSEELIRRLRRAQIARQRVQIFKPEVETQVVGIDEAQFFGLDLVQFATRWPIRESG